MDKIKLSQETADAIFEKVVFFMRSHLSKYSTEGHIKDYLNSLVSEDVEQDTEIDMEKENYHCKDGNVYHLKEN